MTASHTEFLGTRHFAGLDGLRCLAILPVIGHHATARPPSGFWGKGAVGVDLFFVLSGFLITTLLLRERRRTDSIDLRVFYVRRALRIFPLYYAILGLYVLLAAIMPSSPERAHLLHNAVYHATYTANWFVDYRVPYGVPFSFSWSLCIEEQFYLFWPILVALIPSRWVLLITIGGLLGLDSWLTHGGLDLATDGAAFRILTSFSTAIGFGVVLALVLDLPLGFSLLAPLVDWKLAAPLALLGALLTLTVPATPYPWLCFFLALLVAAVVVRTDNGFHVLLNHSWAVWGGRLSYAAYLVHITALLVVRKMFPAQAANFAFVFALGLPLTVVFSLAVHVAIERPFLRRRDAVRPLLSNRT